MTFFDAILVAIIVLIVQTALIMALIVLAGKQIRKEKIRMQDEQLDALYCKLVKLAFKFKKEFNDYKEMMQR